MRVVLLALLAAVGDERYPVVVRWLVVCLAACGFRPGSLGGIEILDGPPDAGDAAIDAPVMLGPWGSATVVFAATGDDDPTLTGDLLELYFNRASDIYVSTRATTNVAWGTPTLVAELSSTSTETTPEITSDGLTIYITSGRTGTLGMGDVWVSTRATRSDPWSTPIQVGELCSTVDDAAPTPTDDQLVLVMTSPRADSAGFYDVYFSERASPTATWSTPVNLMTVNSNSNDYSPMLSQDRLTLYFDSGRTGVSEELFMATRASTADSFSTPVPITELNTGASESDPWVSPDRRHIYFERAGSLYEARR